MNRVQRIADKWLVAFNSWFSSPSGVWQTFLVVLAITVGERVFPHLDPNMFALMAWLTVYSAVTQPALASVGRESAERLERLEEQNAELLRHIETLLSAHNAP